MLPHRFQAIRIKMRLPCDAIRIVLPEAADAACEALRALRRQVGGDNREACRLVLDFYGRLVELRSLPGVAPSRGLKPLP